MSTDKGYIKVYRKIWNHWIWKSNRPFDEFHAWIDLVMLMNHEDKQILFDGKLITVEKGTKITSLRKLADRWGWGKTHVAEFLSMLEKDHMIETVADSKKTTVKVLNYGKYQASKTRLADSDKDTDKDTGKDTDKDADRTQTIHYRSTIEDTIEERKDPAGTDPDEEEGWIDNEGWGFD